MHPEDIPRPFGSYDPNEPMVIPFGDLIAARNAVGHLVQVLTDPVDPPSEFRIQVVQSSVRGGVVRDGEAYEFDSLEETVTWLTELRGRLTGLLPDPPLPGGPPETAG